MPGVFSSRELLGPVVWHQPHPLAASLCLTGGHLCGQAFFPLLFFFLLPFFFSFSLGLTYLLASSNSFPNITFPIAASTFVSLRGEPSCRTCSFCPQCVYRVLLSMFHCSSHDTFLLEFLLDLMYLGHTCGISPHVHHLLVTFLSVFYLWKV